MKTMICAILILFGVIITTPELKSDVIEDPIWLWDHSIDVTQMAQPFIAQGW